VEEIAPAIQGTLRKTEVNAYHVWSLDVEKEEKDLEKEAPNAIERCVQLLFVASLVLSFFRRFV
jgi:hypothetical protein